MAESDPRILVASCNQIGESPVWSSSENSLYWVDVEGKLVQRWNAIDQSVTQWDIGEAVGCIGLRKGGGLVGARRTGFFFLDVDSGKITPICDPEAHVPDNRFNDGKVDRRGRFLGGHAQLSRYRNRIGRPLSSRPRPLGPSHGRRFALPKRHGVEPG
jgi:sugar lactone lactonase YvrE